MSQRSESTTAQMSSPASVSTSKETRDEKTHDEVLQPAKARVGNGLVTVVGLVLSLVVVACGIVGVHDALVATGVVGGTGLVAGAIESSDGVSPALWVLLAGVLAVILGLVLLLVALRPRPRKVVAVRARTGVFMAPRDVAQLATGAAEAVTGVISASSSATLRKVAVRVVSTGDAATETAVREAVEARLAMLEPPPTVRITTRNDGGSR